MLSTTAQKDDSESEFVCATSQFSGVYFIIVMDQKLTHKYAVKPLGHNYGRQEILLRSTHEKRQSSIRQ